MAGEEGSVDAYWPMWDAGTQLMHAASAGGYGSMLASDKLAVADHDDLAACQRQAAKARETVRRTIRVGVE